MLFHHQHSHVIFPLKNYVFQWCADVRLSWDYLFWSIGPDYPLRFLLLLVLGRYRYWQERQVQAQSQTRRGLVWSITWSANMLACLWRSGMWKPGHQTGKEVTSEETLGKECASWEELEVITSPRPPCTALPLSLKLQCNPVPLPNPSCFSCASCGVMKGRTMSMFSEAKMVERIIPISKHCFQKTGHPISS